MLFALLAVPAVPWSILFIIPILCWKIANIFAAYLLTSQKHLHVVRHSILLSKISSLNIPPTALNWIVAFYRAMQCIRGTSHGPVSTVRLSVRPSVRHRSEFY